MKKILLLGLSFITGVTFAQQQIGNSDFELWEASTPEIDEPLNWNSFKTASGGMAWASQQQMQKSTDVRPGTAGVAAVKVFSKSVVGVTANGNMTLGQVVMGSTTASSTSNYNFSKTSDGAFSEALTDQPDSIVFWVKYSNSSASDNARVSAILHTNVDFKDPNDVGDANTVATAILNFPSTSGTWVRKAVAFDYSAGPASANTHIIVTFTSNSVPGGGSSSDYIIVDDVELIYNPATSSLTENSMQNLGIAAYNNALNFKYNGELNGTYEVYDLAGSKIQAGSIQKSVPFTQKSGVYFVRMSTSSGILTKKIYKQ